MTYKKQNFEEQLQHQILEIDQTEWRKVTHQPETVYLAYIDKCPYHHSDDSSITEGIYSELLTKLRKQEKDMRVVEKEDYDRWVLYEKNYTSWNSFDNDICGCNIDQECVGCRSQLKNS